MRRRVAPVVGLAALLLLVGALLSILSPPSPFRAQAAAGADLYHQNCLSCHGGAGGPGVPGKTEPLEGPRFLARNPNALEIFDVVRSGREKSLRALSDEKVWAAIAAELAANGFDPGGRLEFGTVSALTTVGGGSRGSGFFPPGR